MKTKAQYEAANANYWAGRGSTINKGRSVQAGAGELPSPWVQGLQGPLSPLCVSPGRPEGHPRGSGLAPWAQKSQMPTSNQLHTTQFKTLLLSTYWAPDTAPSDMATLFSVVSTVCW